MSVSLRCLPFSLLVLTAPATAQLSVLSTSPSSNALEIEADATIAVQFDRALDASSLPPTTASVFVFGRNQGPVPGSITLEDGDKRLRFIPSESLLAGNDVTVLLTHQVQAADSSFLRSAGYAFRFRVRTTPTDLVFHSFDLFSNRDTSSTTRLYGAAAVDLDDDGWIDLATVNEDSGDVRVFASLGQGEGSFGNMVTPFAPVGSVPSPNEAADFNRDGLVDLCTANASGADVSVLFGNGDGTFQPQQSHAVGNGPHGLVVLEANGDGWPDIATSNTASNDVALLLNDGSGGFLAASFFDGGGNGEYALATGDMNGDGIFDLVVGNRSSSSVTVHLGNGDGTFTQSDTRDAGGSVWMMVSGDVNGDGHLDVSCANSGSDNGSILLGDGTGGLGAASTVQTGNHVVATDLGDLDGDGDLDWVLSCFGGGIWELFENDGTGSFTSQRVFNATNNASCAVMLDIDRDGDLDLALTDEIADQVRIEKNGWSGAPYCFGDGSALACPCANPGGTGEGCRNSTGSGGLLSATGAGSISDDDLAIVASNLPNNQNGLIYAGLNPIQAPFGDGHRCVAGAIVRFPVRNAGSGGSFTEANVASNLGLLAGETRRFQAWFRDPMGPCGSGHNLTHALAVTFAP